MLNPVKTLLSVTIVDVYINYYNNTTLLICFVNILYIVQYIINDNYR